MQYIKSIKATALNRGKPRIWLEHNLSPYGFERGNPVRVNYEEDRIVIVAFPETAELRHHGLWESTKQSDRRIVAGRTRNGKDIHIFDLTCGTNYQDCLRAGHSKLAVYCLDNGVLVICNDKGSAKT